MDDTNHEQRPRASLRGKGREILLGQQGALPDSEEPAPLVPRAPAGGIDASSLSLTPEEAEALLNLSPDLPVHEGTFSTSSTALPPTPAEQEPVVPAQEEPPAWWEDTPHDEDAAAVEEESPEWWGGPEEVPGAVAEQAQEVGDTYAEAPVEGVDDLQAALPLAERSPDLIIQEDNLPYYAAPEVDDLVPPEPESWSDSLEDEALSARPTVFARLERFKERAADEHEGGLVVPEGSATERTAVPGISDPFDPVFQRQPSDVLFSKTDKPDGELLNILVDDTRIRKLSQQIEALQEELSADVYSDWAAADEYQKELLRASSLLLKSRANYDDARAVVYRVRTDMNRRRKVRSDIMRYRPLLMNYYMGWGIALVVLFLLRELFTGITEAVGVGVFAALYYPMLFGIVGALISGYLTLERHTTRLRDFDPLHISWYLFNPLLGGVMGLLMFLLASIANEDLLHNTASDAERAITYLLCVVGGMNQNNVLRQLNDLLDRFGRGSRR